jgi:uridine kinase
LGEGGKRAPEEKDLRQIERRMWQLVDANLPIEAKGNEIYGLENYTNCFYGLMPPATGYIYSFALELMRGGVLLRFPHPSDPARLSFYKRDSRIFDAYEEEQDFLDGLQLGQIGDLNRQIGAGSAPDIIRIAEHRHQARIQEIAQKIVGSEKRIILVAGPSSSGKTTFSKRLIKALESLGVPEPLYLGTDDYFVDREFAPRDKKGDYNYEGLDAVDVDLFVRNMMGLLSGETVDLPKYDFITGVKNFGMRECRLKEGQAIVVEGIHALNKKMSAGIEDKVKYKIYISPLTQLNIDDHNRVPSTDVRLLRRMIRDHRTRGNSVLDTIRRWPKVRAGESVNIFPYNNEADEIFNSTLIYELPVLKKYVEPLLKEIKHGEAAYGHAKWLLYFLSLFTPIMEESEIPPESILREFIGGSSIK